MPDGQVVVRYLCLACFRTEQRQLVRCLSKAPVSTLPPPEPGLLAVLLNRCDFDVGLTSLETRVAVGSLTNHHPDSSPTYWATQLLLEWHFGRLQVHQLVGHKVWGVEGWSLMPDSRGLESGMQMVSLPQIFQTAMDEMAAALDYKLRGAWISQNSMATRTMPEAQCFLNTDAAINFWLPESVFDAMGALGKELELTRSDVIRNILFLFLYGRVFYEDCLAHEQWKARWRDAERFDGDIMFSRRSPVSSADQPESNVSKSAEQAPRTAYVAAHGKSVQSIKVWLPSVMREHLEKFNESNSHTLAEMVRRVITTDLLGHAGARWRGTGV